MTLNEKNGALNGPAELLGGLWKFKNHTKIVQKVQRNIISL